MNRKRVPAEPDLSRFRGSLRICDPDGTRMPGVEPEIASFLIEGHPFQLVHWTKDEWDRLPEEERPGDACRGSKGSFFRFQLTPPADRSG